MRRFTWHGSRKWILGVGVAVAAAALIVGGCVNSRTKTWAERFPGRPEPVSVTYEASPHPVHARETGLDAGPLILMVHGSPGDASAFVAYLADVRLTSVARLIAVDRLGWGDSGTELVPDMRRQAAAIANVLRAHPTNRPVIMVGHSLGGPVIARVAMDYPALVDGLVIVAGSIDPAMEKTTWYQSVSRWPGVRSFVPAELKRADAEIAPLKDDLKAMMPAWAGLRLPVVLIQGTADTLVPPENAAFAERMMVNAALRVERVPDEGHFILWQRRDLVIDAILSQLAKLRAETAAAVGQL